MSQDAADPHTFSEGMIRAATVLPARREDVELHTADGLTLVGELALPVDREPVATLLTLHPLPTHGGFMDSHVLRKAANRLPALADLAVLRFNLRGVTSPRGTSEGTFDSAVGERFDVAAAIELAEFRDLPDPWLLGWSFGTDLALMHGCDPAVVGVILLSPPLRYSTPADLDRWAQSGKPVVALVPEHDDYLRPPGGAGAVRRDPAGGGGRGRRRQAPVGRRARRPSRARRGRRPGQPGACTPADVLALTPLSAAPAAAAAPAGRSAAAPRRSGSPSEHPARRAACRRPAPRRR
jgi:alpha/beta superfamily hydrolase